MPPLPPASDGPPPPAPLAPALPPVPARAPSPAPPPVPPAALAPPVPAPPASFPPVPPAPPQPRQSNVNVERRASVRIGGRLYLARARRGARRPREELPRDEVTPAVRPRVADSESRRRSRPPAFGNDRYFMGQRWEPGDD